MNDIQDGEASSVADRSREHVTPVHASEENRVFDTKRTLAATYLFSFLVRVRNIWVSLRKTWYEYEGKSFSQSFTVGTRSEAGQMKNGQFFKLPKLGKNGLRLCQTVLGKCEIGKK